jgi:hypothetical protein
MMPKALTNRLPAGMKLPESINSRLPGIKTYLSAGKYVIEAFVNFYQSVRSFIDASESADASAAANAQADRQEVRGAARPFLPDINVFANASQSDLLKAIHQVSSSPDGRELAYAAGLKAKGLAEEIRVATASAERNAYLMKLNLENLAKKEAELRATGERLQTIRRGLGRFIKPDVYLVPPGWGAGISGKDALDKIDDALGKIQRYLNPVPNWIAPYGRFGPRVGPQ